MGCGMGMIKYLLFIFNFIFALCGLAILIVGVLVHLRVKHLIQTDGIEDNISFPSITLIVIGSIIFVIAFFGCCGAIRESHCMTITFASFLLTILIVQVAIAIYAFVAIKNSSDDISITNGYRKLFNKYWVDDAKREAVDIVQSSMSCCGVQSYRDFDPNPNLSFNGTIPWSCCNGDEGSSCNGDVSKIFQEGCGPKLKEFIKYGGTILGGLAVGIAGVELIGIIFALCLANSIRNSERRGYRV